jgi:hypothetical protein
MRLRTHMNDYHYTEIRLSRELAAAIAELNEQYKNIIPLSIWQPYLKLREHYEREKENGIS